MANSRTRMTLDLSTRLNAAVEAYAEAHGVSKSEVLRDALNFLFRAERATEDGMTVLAVKEDPETNKRIERDLGLESLSRAA